MPNHGQIQRVIGTAGGAGMRTAEMVRSEILELQIKRAGLCVELALLNGQPKEAREFQKLMNQLIQQRSPEQIARMEAALDRTLETF